MISAWWLLTLIPAVWLGFFLAGVVRIASDEPVREIKHVRNGSAGL